MQCYTSTILQCTELSTQSVHKAITMVLYEISLMAHPFMFFFVSQTYSLNIDDVNFLTRNTQINVHLGTLGS